MNDIVSTADAFTSNFSDKGPFDYSIESLVLVDNLLEELSIYGMKIIIVLNLWLDVMF